MKYIYAYKTSDGTRHEEAMEAESREAVFVALREKGIKAIKVIAADGSKANGELRGVSKRKVIGFCLGVAAAGGYLGFLVGEWVGFGLKSCEGGFVDAVLKLIVLLISLTFAFLGFPQFKGKRWLFWLLVALGFAGSSADFLMWTRDSAAAEQRRNEADNWYRKFDDKIEKVAETASSTRDSVEGLRKDVNLRAHKEMGLDYLLVSATNRKDAIARISYPPHLVPLSEAVLKEWNAENYEGALIIARQCEGLINESIAKVDGVPFEQDGGFVVAMSHTYNALAEECFHKGNYKESADYWTISMSNYVGVMPMERAWRDAAALRAKGKRLKFFTPDEIAEIRSWEVGAREFYLSCLAELGYLLPIELDFAANDYHYIDYAKVFALNRAIDYLAVLCETYTDADGAVAHSNYLVLQRCGRDKFQLVDLDEAVSFSLGKRPEKHKNYPTLIRPNAQTVKALENVPRNSEMPSLVFDRERNKEQVLIGGYLSEEKPLKVEMRCLDLTPDALD